MVAAEQIVRAFCDAWATGDVTEILRNVADDVQVHFVPTDPFSGRWALHQILDAAFARVDSISFELRSMASAADGRILVERVDVIIGKSGAARLPVMAAFNVSGGLITQWSDYYDQEQFTAALASVGGRSN
jgi:limonene-1,2-epoxide hydrolase